jgi:hypothetical protein
MRDLITQLFSNYSWFTAKSGNDFAGSEAVAFAKENKLVGTKLTGKDGKTYRINVNTYFYRNQEKESLWLNPISENEIESDVMQTKYSLAE